MTMATVMYFIVGQAVPARAPLVMGGLEPILLVIAAVLVGSSFPTKARLRGQPGGGRDLARERIALIAALVLCEAAAILGLVEHFVTGSPRYYVLILIGLVGMLMHYPQRGE